MALQRGERHFASGNVLIPLGIGPLFGFVAANAISARGAKAETQPSRADAPYAGAKLRQRKRAVDTMGRYLDAFHFYADDMGRQLEAHHFCTHLSQDLHQCVIYESDGPDARLIGIEYIVSERLFRQLPEDERRLWHSHHYQVKSGQLVHPDLPEMAEQAAMADLVSTYGKTFHNWQIDRHDLPLGIPQLMMAFTRDGQADPEMVRERDNRFGISTDQKRRNRAAIPMPTPLPGVNPWESGQSLQTDIRAVPIQNLR